MFKRAGFYLFMLLILGSKLCFALPENPFVFDSTGVETKNGQTFILHRVESGQTLYAVMRKYKTTIQAIKEANPGMKDNLITGQIVRVPSSRPATAAPKVATTTPPKEPEKTKEPEKPTEKAKVIIDYEIKTPKAEESAAKTAPPVESKEAPKTEAPKIEAPKIETAAVAEKTPEPATEKKDTKPATVAPKTGIHRVEGGQSLYGIAVKYGVLMADIRKWNNLTSDQLRSGQELIVSEQAYNDYLKRHKSDSVKLADARKTETEKMPLPPRTDDPTNANLPEPKITNTGKRILETGIAEVLDGVDSGNKYLALHRTAPVGSLIQVKNINNSQSIWVKVIGKLPDISANNRIIIKLSARAQEKLSPGGKQFVAEISYLSQ
ncbi:MAG: LysM peptidoglycan-binding domain-containing protein [Runella sp.]